MKFSLPSINFKSESPQLYSFLKKVKEVIELREGIYGVSDSFVTREELKSLGPGDIGGGGGVGEGGNAWVPEGLTSLNPPKNLKLDRLGIFYTIVLSWDNAENHTGVEGTEIWCSYTNNKSDAFRVGLVAFPEKEFVFVPENVAHDYYFWIRHIGNGLYSPWEPSNVQGGYVVTSESLIAITVKELLEKLKGNIHEDLLAQDVISLINSSSMEVRPFDAQTKWIKGDWVCSNQKIYKCLKNIVSLPCPTPPSDEFWKLIGEGDAITDIIDGNVFAIKDSLAKIKKQEDSITLISQDITALQSSIEDTEENISANANAISSLNTTVTNQAGEISAHSSSINLVSTTVGNHTASIQQLSQSVNGLNAQYTLKVNANGHVAGIGLAANSDVSEMVLVADKFKIINPAQPGVPAKQPFTISTIEGKTFIGIDGNLLVAGDKTFMKDGYINTEILQINDKMIVGRLSKNKLDSSLETQSGASSKANNAESNSKSYTRGWCQQGADKTQTALNNGADISRARANGYTLIDGGYIRTGLITANNIRTGTLDANQVNVINLNASYIRTGILDANRVIVTNLSASSISSGTLDASDVNITNLNASSIKTGTLDASRVNVTNLNANNIKTGILQSSDGNLQLDLTNSDIGLRIKGGSSLIVEGINQSKISFVSGGSEIGVIRGSSKEGIANKGIFIESSKNIVLQCLNSHFISAPQFGVIAFDGPHSWSHVITQNNEVKIVVGGKGGNWGGTSISLGLNEVELVVPGRRFVFTGPKGMLEYKT